MAVNGVRTITIKVGPGIQCPNCGAFECHPTDDDKCVIRAFKVDGWSQCLRCSGAYSRDLKTYNQDNHDPNKGWF